MITNKTDAVRQQIEKMMGGGYEVEIFPVTKQNQVLTGIRIVDKSKSQQLTPVLYPNIANKTVEEIAFETVHDYHMAMNSGVAEGYMKLVDDVTDFTTVKDRIFVRLFDKELSKELLDTKPHIDVMECLAAVPYLKLGKAGDFQAEGITSTAFTYDMLKAWEKTPEELYEIGIKNLVNYWGARLTPISGAIGMPSFDSEPFILSNLVGMFGATAILYPNILDELYAKVGGEFYIIPSSVHEVLITPAHDKPYESDGILEMIKDVNDSVLDTEDILSYKCWYYDGQNIYNFSN